MTVGPGSRDSRATVVASPGHDTRAETTAMSFICIRTDSGCAVGSSLPCASCPCGLSVFFVRPVVLLNSTAVESAGAFLHVLCLFAQLISRFASFFFPICSFSANRCSLQLFPFSAECRCCGSRCFQPDRCLQFAGAQPNAVFRFVFSLLVDVGGTRGVGVVSLFSRDWRPFSARRVSDVRVPSQ